MRSRRAALARSIRSVFENLEQRQLLAGINPFDFGDAPDTYKTTLAVDGARHEVLPGINLRLGAAIDIEADGQPSMFADKDDTTGIPDDEDGVAFLDPIVQGTSVDVQVTNGGAASVLNAWFDFNVNGTFDTGEQIFTNLPLPPAMTVMLSFNVPSTATVGTSYSRFRINQQGAIGPSGFGGPGEVEDYCLAITAPTGTTMDFGDAPDTYRTTLAVNGARHTATPNLLLGAAVDVEADGAPSANADRDDLTGVVDDEDGILFLDPIVPGTSVDVQVTNGAAAGFLNAWLDFNINGAFDAGEQIFTNLGLPAASTTVQTFFVPASATPGASYSRFRLSGTVAAAPSPAGAGGIGEVEDYPVKIAPPVPQLLDYGDAPNSYGTRLAVNGARHQATPNIRLGAPNVDSEPDGQPSPGANRDDLNGVDDEDGVIFLSPIVQGAIATVQVTNGGGPARLNAWMDFNINGAFDPGEQIFANFAMAAASVNILNFPVPAAAATGVTYSRWRVNQPGGLAPTGFGGFGEVEDYQNKIDSATPPRMDYGDAPDSYGTKLASNGARHNGTPNIRLGALVDVEADGQPTVAADGDDTNAADDEDGVLFLTPITIGQNATVQVTNGAAAGRLNAWFDFNANGVFEPAEQIFTNVPMAAASVNVLNFFVPLGSAVGPTYSRFRVNQNGGLGPTGFGGFGEVEDYSNRTSPPQTQLDFGDAPDTVTGLFQYPTLLGGASGNPARHVISPNGPRLGALIDGELDGQPNVTATGDDINNLDDEDGVFIGGVPLDLAVLTTGAVNQLQIVNTGAPGLLNAWLDFGQNGNWTAAEQIALNVPIPAGVTLLNVNIPANLNPGTFVYSRFRLSTTANLQPTGIADNGEVEDYRTVLRAPPTPQLLDFGDAPEAAGAVFQYPTTLGGPSGDPARHVIVTAGPRLGNRIDPEPDGQPNPAASGDDIGLLFGGIDDEDGVTVAGAPLETTPLVPGAIQVVQVNNPTAIPGLLNAWYDWNSDGDWNDPGEQVATNVPVGPGLAVLAIPVPGGLSPTREIYSRFRINTAGGLSPKGLAQDGEVEDYVQRVRVDTAKPFVVATRFEYETSQSLVVEFSEDMDPQSVMPADVKAINTDTNQSFAAMSVEWILPYTLARFMFNTSAMILPDGDYRFGISDMPMDMAGNNLMSENGLGGPDTFWKAGDANHDRTTNISDFSLMAANFNRPGTFSHGDFNYSGTTEIGDFSILASKFNTVLMGDLPRGSTSIAGAALPADSRNLFAGSRIADELVDVM